MPVIADVKRGDIAKTAEMYAKAHFAGDFEVDYITLAPTWGWIPSGRTCPYVQQQGRAVLLWCAPRTPAQGTLNMKRWPTAATLRLVGDKLHRAGPGVPGRAGLFQRGAVIGGTHIEEAAEIRAQYADSFSLIPGYGAQGGNAADIARYLSKGATAGP